MSSALSPSRRTVLAGAAALASVAGSAVAQETSGVVETSLGKVRGVREGGVSIFRGIPYGADTAQRRFMAPVAAPAWSGVRDAIQYGARAPQAGRGSRPPFVLSKSWTDLSVGMSEDCLCLNVWTPQAGTGKRPVMVWFHGGGFAAGSGASDLYDGVPLARDEDVVVVTVNHRLGPLGYLYLAELGGPDFADSGQAGMIDLVLALQWVRDNIGAFGGDPGNVTIFGESGGGCKVSLMLGMPSAKGLFHKAIIQSGAYLNGGSRATGTRMAEAVLKNLGLTRATIQDIRKLPYAQILGAVGDNSKMVNRVAFRPTTDGRALPHDPFDPVATPLARDVPIIVGNTRWEYIYQFGMEDPGLFDLTWETLVPRLSGAISDLAIPGKAEDIIAYYRQNWPSHTAGDIYFAALTDARMLRQSIQLAERKAAQGGAPVYMYMVEWRTPVDGGRWKAPHVLDVPFVFKTTDKAVSLVGEGETPKRLSDEMSGAWAAFARTGKPVVPNGPAWPAYDAKSRATLQFDNTTTLGHDPEPAMRRFWAGA